MKNSLHLAGQLQSAHASEKHPFQTMLQFILTDFQPNKNKQAIPYSEAEHIIDTAIGMPVKIKFNGITAQGHAGSRPIGPITRAWVEDDKILAEATVWNREFADIDAFLKSANAEQETIGTSWELLYDKSTTDEAGVEWFEDIIFSATTIVEKPAYGKERTRILAVAEDMLMSDQIGMTIDDLYTLIGVLSELWGEVYEQEKTESAIENASEVIDRARNILIKVKEQKKIMAELQENELETLRAQVADFEAKLQTAETERLALAEFKQTTERGLLFSARAEQLHDLFSADEITNRKDMLLALSEEAFSAYVTDLQAVQARKSAVAEHKNIRVPDLAGNAGLSIPTLAEELNKLGVKKL